NRRPPMAKIRKRGSGTATQSANRTADYLKAMLEGREADAAHLLREIVAHCAAQDYKIRPDPKRACPRGADLLRASFPNPEIVRAISRGDAGDLVFRHDGSEYHCEIKTQFGKPKLTDLTQAD